MPCPKCHAIDPRFRFFAKSRPTPGSVKPSYIRTPDKYKDINGLRRCKDKFHGPWKPKKR